MCHNPLVPAVTGDAESCKKQESPEEVERVVETQTEEVDVSLCAPRYLPLTQTEARGGQQSHRQEAEKPLSLGEGSIHLPTELWQPQDLLPPPPPATCIHVSPPVEGDVSWDSGTKALTGKRKLLFRWLAVAPTSLNLECSLAASLREGRRIAVEEILDVKESCILEEAMAFPHPRSYLQFQTINAYSFHISYVWFLAPLYLI